MGTLFPHLFFPYSVYWCILYEFYVDMQCVYVFLFILYGFYMDTQCVYVVLCILYGFYMDK